VGAAEATAAAQPPTAAAWGGLERVAAEADAATSSPVAIAAVVSVRLIDAWNSARDEQRRIRSSAAAPDSGRRPSVEHSRAAMAAASGVTAEVGTWRKCAIQQSHSPSSVSALLLVSLDCEPRSSVAPAPPWRKTNSRTMIRRTRRCISSARALGSAIS
jgi:hypothetical protein